MFEWILNTTLPTVLERSPLAHLRDLGTPEGLQKFSKKVLEKGTAPLIISLSQSLLYKHKCNSVISVIALID